jgi:hypothetical protein
MIKQISANKRKTNNLLYPNRQEWNKIRN